jgi:hypothetical protein
MSTIYKFYGVDSNCFKLNDTIYEAVEDPDDGYRSCMEELRVVAEPDNLIFHSLPLANVLMQEEDEDIDLLVDADTGHVWLRYGTDYSDSYYPCFVFEYTPPSPVK